MENTLEIKMWQIETPHRGKNVVLMLQKLRIVDSHHKKKLSKKSPCRCGNQLSRHRTTEHLPVMEVPLMSLSAALLPLQVVHLQQGGKKGCLSSVPS